VKADIFVILTSAYVVAQQFESNFILTTKLTVEGPLRLKEEYIDGVIEMPNVPESSIPTQLKDSYGQVLTAFEQLPTPVKETLSSGLKIPLSMYISVL
jgi:hypothetical protein